MTSTLRSSPKRDEQARRLGQVFTPRPIADWMVRWACAHEPRQVLDPAVGRGVFIEAVEALVNERWLSTSPSVHPCRPFGTDVPPGSSLPRRRCHNQPTWSPRVDACELDARMLAEFSGIPRRLEVHCRGEDFVTAVFNDSYDAIIANPPYIRHHEMRCGPDVFAGFDRICRRRISRMTNLYGLFLVKIWTLLAECGRAAVITPAEWLNADFGLALKTYLLGENAIDAIVHFHHAANIFEGALTTAAITLLRRGRGGDEPVGFCSVETAAELSDETLGRAERFPPGDLDPAAKWTPLFSSVSQQCNQRRPPSADKEAVLVRHRLPPANSRPSDVFPGLFDTPSEQPREPLQRDATSPTLGDVARCMRGIATGANNYFTLRESDRRRWNIDVRDLRLCITKAQHITADQLTRDDVQRLIDADRRIHLLCPRPGLTAEVERYLEEGRRQGVDQRYLPAHRPVWYRPEHREPAPILVSVFARGEFRFALNEAGVLNLTAYHGIYPHALDGDGVLALFDYLNGPAARVALRDHRRIYGDGLFKLEPRDVEALPIPGDYGAGPLPAERESAKTRGLGTPRR